VGSGEGLCGVCHSLVRQSVYNFKVIDYSASIFRAYRHHISLIGIPALQYIGTVLK
jgi:hypothetical protein